MAKIYVAKRVIDYVGLMARGIPESTLAIDETMAPVLALLQGMGPDGAKLLNVDANGNLVVPVQGPSQVGGGQPFNYADVRKADFDTYGYANDLRLMVEAGIELVNGTTGGAVHWRTANPADLAT